MTEAEIVASTGGAPITRPRLRHDLETLGVEAGGTYLVHASLSAIGWVVGGAESVILALEDAAGDAGTVMMPAYSGNAPEPSLWHNPPVPEAWWPVIRAEMPPFDVDLSPSQHVGVIAETFRKQRGTRRSGHPNESFAARGPKADYLTSGHGLDHGLGEESPLARLYQLDGHVLLLGVDHSANSSLHLAEYRSEWPGKSVRTIQARIATADSVRDIEFKTINLDSSDFAEIGRDFEGSPGSVRTGSVGRAASRLMRQRAVVDFGTRWIPVHRGPARSASGDRR
jgi:aminoglycoside 3-N-acetyltransferase